MAKQNVVLIKKTGSPLDEAIDQTLYRDLDMVVWQVEKPPLPVAADGQAWALWDVSGYNAQDALELAPALAESDTPVVLLCARADESVCGILDALRGREDSEPTIIGLVHAPEAHGGALTTLLRPSLDYLALLRRKEDEITRLREELEDRRIIERAKYSLMFSRNISEEQAYAMIRTHSRNTNQRMVEVAQKILLVTKQFNGQTNK